MKFRPLHDRVIVKRIEGEEKSAGGIIIPTRRRRSRHRARSSRSGPESATRPAGSFRLTSRLATVCCPALKHQD
jgi:co-chaperonin GroES (HSP10)